MSKMCQRLVLVRRFDGARLLGWLLFCTRRAVQRRGRFFITIERIVTRILRCGPRSVIIKHVDDTTMIKHTYVIARGDKNMGTPLVRARSLLLSSCSLWSRPFSKFVRLERPREIYVFVWTGREYFQAVHARGTAPTDEWALEHYIFQHPLSRV